jgi:hypothetical protein
MNPYIFACIVKKQYNYHGMIKKALVLLFFSFTLTLTQAQNYKLHSVFIYSFTRYVQWPDAYNSGDFEIMVLGDSPILDELKAMAQAKKVGDRNIRVTRINSPSDIKKCNILFVPASKSSLINDVLAKVNTQSILVVTEEAGLGLKGSNINFITKDGKLAFELNQASIGKQNLRVSNELSRLAIMI